MACTCVCAPAIVEEMTDWISIGGQNWGCCGNAAHTTGFHRAACQIPVTDYSRKHEPGKPFNMNWACAGDFAHMGVPALRARHATLWARRLAGDPSLSMICEMIGQPWPGQPVMYWSAWEGVLKRYTGVGHDTWSHYSWWRSRANERAFLWTGTGGGSMATTLDEIKAAINDLRQLIVQGTLSKESALYSWLRAQEGVRPKQTADGLDWSVKEPLPDTWPIMRILHAVEGLTAAPGGGVSGSALTPEQIVQALLDPRVAAMVQTAAKEALRTGTDSP